MVWYSPFAKKTEDRIMRRVFSILYSVAVKTVDSRKFEVLQTRGFISKY